MIELAPKDQSKPKRVVSLPRAVQLYKKGDFDYETEYTTILFYMDIPIDVTQIDEKENKIYFEHEGKDNMKQELGSMIVTKLKELKGVEKWKIDYQDSYIKVEDAKGWADTIQTVDVCVQAKFDLTKETVTIELNAI